MVDEPQFIPKLPCLTDDLAVHLHDRAELQASDFFLAAGAPPAIQVEENLPALVDLTFSLKASVARRWIQGTHSKLLPATEIQRRIRSSVEKSLEINGLTAQH